MTIHLALLLWFPLPFSHCPLIFFYIFCLSHRVGLHIDCPWRRLKPFRVKQLWKNTLFFRYCWHLPDRTVTVLHFTRLPPRKGWQGAWGGRKRRGEGKRKSPSCHNTELRILLCFDSNVSDSPCFVLKFGGGVESRVWEMLGLQLWHNSKNL